MSEWYICNRTISSGDFENIASIHRAELKEGFITSLGQSALTLLFRFAAESEHAILLIARNKETDEPISYLMATSNISKFYSDFILKHSFTAVMVLGRKILRPATFRKLIELLFYPTKKESRAYPSAELLDIAVQREFQGAGVAKALFYELVNIYKIQAIDEFKITTGESLSGAHAFYEKLGAEKVDEITVHEGSKTIVYIYKIDISVENEVRMLPLNKHMIAAVLAVHMEAYHGMDNIASRLGPKFIKKTYKWFVLNDDAFGFVGLVDGSVAGVIVGSKLAAMKGLNRYRFFSGLISFLCRPGLIVKYCNPIVLWRRLFVKIYNEWELDIDSDKAVYLYSMAVKREFTKLHISNKLLKETESYCVDENLTPMLTSIGRANTASMLLHHMMGFKLDSAKSKENEKYLYKIAEPVKDES